MTLPYYRQVVTTVRVGLLGGAVALYLTMVGLVSTFAGRDVIDRILSLGLALLLINGLSVGYAAGWFLARRHTDSSRVSIILGGAIAGLLSGGLLSLFVIIGNVVNLRAVFLNASPALYSLLTFDYGVEGAWIPMAGMGAAGAAGAITYLLPGKVRRPLIGGLVGVIGMGLFAEILRPIVASWPAWAAQPISFLFGTTGLTAVGSSFTFLVTSSIILARLVWRRKVNEGIQQMTPARQRALRYAGWILIILLVIFLPLISGRFISQVIVLVGLYALMGLGLNVTLGYAGLFDLGFVAFFAIGAYTLALLTSFGEHGIAFWPFWAALPISVLVAMIAGSLFGMPVLGIRGDYLAIATLGFGEIVRLLVGSDFLRPRLGGSFGVLDIPKPWLGGFELAGPQHLYYVVVASALLVAFASRRLRDSRLGRAWMAVREDEDVAQALGVNLIQTKLLAYSLGAAFAGLGGAIFATLVSSIFPHSMKLDVSINVVAVIIVGGMGSIPGVIVGAITLIGLPELFREFSEFRYLFYGIALMVMMLVKPEGLWPSAVRARELHVDQAEETELERS